MGLNSVEVIEDLKQNLISMAGMKCGEMGIIREFPNYFSSNYGKLIIKGTTLGFFPHNGGHYDKESTHYDKESMWDKPCIEKLKPGTKINITVGG